MNKYTLTYILILLFTITVSGQENNSRIIIKKGEADISSIDFTSDNFVKLNGEWEFFPNEFIAPEKSPNDFSEQFTIVPGLWNKSDFKDLKSGQGYASYRLRVKISENNENLALRIKRIESAYKLFYNDSLIAQCGKPGKSKEEMTPHKKTDLIYLPYSGNEFTLTFHISNFYHKKGGIISEIQLGNIKKITRNARTARGYEMLFLGAILIMAFYHLGLFKLRKEDLSSLYLGLLLIIVQIHMLVNGEVYLSKIVPNINWEIMLKIDFITNYLTVTFFFLFFRSLNRKMYSKFAASMIVAVTLIMSFISLVTNALFYTNLLPVFEFIAVITGIYVIIILTIAIIRKQKYAVFPFIGTFFITISALNDILHEQMIIQTFYALPLGLIVFIFFQTYVLNLKFTKMVNETNRINRLTQKLDSIKDKFLHKSAFDFDYPLEIFSKELGADYGIIFLPVKSELKIISTYPTFVDKEIPERMSKKIIAEVLLSEKHIIEYPNSNKKKKAQFAFPFKKNNKIEHILYLEKTEAFSQEEIQIPTLLTEQILGLSENFRLFKELKELNSRLEEIVDERTKEVRLQQEALEQQRDEIKQQGVYLKQIFSELKKKNKSITSGILYAQKIQHSLFASENTLNEIFPTHFIYFKPKEIIGGDFYWAEKFGHNNIFCAADCTGHGVPGALVSIVGINLLNRAVHEQKILQPSKILDSLQQNIRKALSQEKDSKSKDGMDLALINYNEKTGILQFSAARNSAYLIRQGELRELKADKMSIGGAVHARIKEGRKFSNIELKVEEGDIIYLMSDGYIDQIGGEHRRKFMRKRMKELFLNLANEEINVQKEQFDRILKKWRANVTQMDDIIVVGIRF